MNAYILIAIVVLAVIALLVFLIKPKNNAEKMTRLASFAFAFVLAGIVFGENRLVGYGLMGIGIILAIVDIYKKQKR